MPRLNLERGDRPEQTLARSHGQAELLQIRLFEIAQIAGLDLLGLEYVGILAESEPQQPLAQPWHEFSPGLAL
jgi:hypothetical protein